MEHFIVFISGFLLDLVFGDPYWLPHPIIFIGKLISIFETFLRKIFPSTKAGQRVAGGFLVWLVLSITGGVAWSLIWGLTCVHPLASMAFKILLTYQILATRCLVIEGKKVEKVLIYGDLEQARTAVGYLVGRDTQKLSSEGVTKATVETIAENAVDGVVAPLCYLAIGGPVLGILYKAVNTMDSMVGYKNEKYQYFGTIAARLDDVCNYIPARFTALIMIFTTFLLGFNGKLAWKIWRRDRLNHKSPNSAQTEAVCAGALGLQLAGDSVYFGKVMKKPTIGDKTRDIIPQDISKTCTLLYGTAWISALVLGGILLSVAWIF